MAQYGLTSIKLETQVNRLSGGELTRLQLAFAFTSNPDILLLDEPSNNLDQIARRQLYSDIQAFKGTLVVASHDRELLEHMDKIYELSSLGLSEFGGSYSFYEQEKKKKIEVAETMLHARINQLAKAKKQIQKRREIHEQAEAKGRRTKRAMITEKGRTDRLALDKAKARSEKTNNKIRTQAEHKVTKVNNELIEAKSKVEDNYKFNISLPFTNIHARKKVIEINSMYFNYKGSHQLFKGFSMSIHGPDRVAIDGPNGCGKSTLFSLLLGKLSPNQGSCKIKVDKVSYLDQKAAGLDLNMTVLENFKRHNSTMESDMVFQVLAFFLFRKEILQQKVSTLSGGERVRLLMACVLMAEDPPQLLILDEPTNHLDIDSIQCIENALQKFEGAILVVCWLI